MVPTSTKVPLSQAIQNPNLVYAKAERNVGPAEPGPVRLQSEIPPAVEVNGSVLPITVVPRS